MNEYKNGMLKTTEQMIFFCKNEIEKIKNTKTTPNTNRQITNDGKLAAYNKTLQKLLVKKERLLKK